MSADQNVPLFSLLSSILFGIYFTLVHIIHSKGTFSFFLFFFLLNSLTQGLEKFQMPSLMEMKQIYTQKMRFSFPMHPYCLTFENLRVKMLSF